MKRSRRTAVSTQQGEAQAVVLDVATYTYEALRDATLLLQLTAQGEADVQAGRTLPQSEVFARARRRLSLPLGASA
jgi:PHD/YefM family antitoxin component YafN of YafNO toxin-antitoxin module